MCKFSVGEEVVCVDNKTPVVENPWHLANLLTVGRHYVVLEVEEWPGNHQHPAHWYVTIDHSGRVWHEDHFRPTKREVISGIIEQKVDA
jgi:hypothetical protein